MRARFMTADPIMADMEFLAGRGLVFRTRNYCTREQYRARMGESIGKGGIFARMGHVRGLPNSHTRVTA